MAGVGKEAAIIDVVAVANELLAGTSPVPASPELSRCGLGHENSPASRFCGTCGLPMDVPPPPGADYVAEGRPKPAAELTGDEKAERERQHAEVQAALARAEREVPDIAAQEDPSPAKLHIHFIEDGFTWAGRVWNIGDELEIGPDHPRWASALPWITLSKADQIARYGRAFFEKGPWPYQQIPPGTEIPLPEAGMRRVQALRAGQGLPARAGDEGNLIPL